MGETDFGETAPAFPPLKAKYYRAHSALEALSAPKGATGGVAPRGLSQLGLPMRRRQLGAFLEESVVSQFRSADRRKVGAHLRVP